MKASRLLPLLTLLVFALAHARGGRTPQRTRSAGAHLHAVAAQRLGPIERRIGVRQQPVGNGLQVGLMPPDGPAATPTETVRVRSICAVSTKVPLR